jgi:hypothetical protein
MEPVLEGVKLSVAREKFRVSGAAKAVTAGWTRKFYLVRGKNRPAAIGRLQTALFEAKTAASLLGVQEMISVLCVVYRA